ncbi:MAG: hypothetical protein EOO41_01850 [Methanobacteriota archaeon]|nr:MAG: hypothetical protein EOO41_01850 [Euryarchaeota archaeon]
MSLALWKDANGRPLQPLGTPASRMLRANGSTQQNAAALTSAFLILPVAVVDPRWQQAAGETDPGNTPPQSHVANLRFNASWHFTNAEWVVRGRTHATGELISVLMTSEWARNADATGDAVAGDASQPSSPAPTPVARHGVHIRTTCASTQTGTEDVVASASDSLHMEIAYASSVLDGASAPRSPNSNEAQAPVDERPERVRINTVGYLSSAPTTSNAVYAAFMAGLLLTGGLATALWISGRAVRQRIGLLSPASVAAALPFSGASHVLHAASLQPAPPPVASVIVHR